MRAAMPKTRNQTKKRKKNVDESDETVVDGQEWRDTNFDENELNVDDSDSSSTDEDTRRTDKRKAKKDTPKKSIPINNDQQKDLQGKQQEHKPKGEVSEASGRTKQGLKKDDRSITEKQTILEKRKAKEDTPKKSIPINNDQRKDLQDGQQEYDGTVSAGVSEPLMVRTEQGKGPKKENDRSTENQTVPVKHTGFYHILLFVIIAFLVVLLAVFAPYFLPEEIRPDFLYSKNSDERFDYPKIFNNRVEELKQLFPNQTDRFWRIVKSKGVAHLRNKKPKQPLVILMGAPPSAHSVVDCLAKKIAWSLNPEVKASDFIDGSAYSGDNGDKTKKHLDDTLENIFQQGVRSAVVMHLERLPPPSPLLFYKYCDNDEAPYKHAGILFTVHLPNEPNAALNPVEAEGSIETYLLEIAWSKFPYESDSISALLSRIADTVVLVSKETEEVVKSVCKL